jgi:hypothetical protein
MAPASCLGDRPIGAQVDNNEIVLIADDGTARPEKLN